MTDKAALHALKAGDRVVVLTNNGNRITLVERTSASMIFIGSARFSRDTGLLIGAGKWDSSQLSLDERDFDTAREQRAARLMKGFAFSREGVEEMRKVADHAETVLRGLKRWHDDTTPESPTTRKKLNG